MSIIITNTTPYGDATCQYTVRINNHPVIAQFIHTRSDGLAMCLAKAANAVLLENIKEGIENKVQAKATRLATLKEVREMILFMSNNYLDPKRVDTLTYVLRQIDGMVDKELL